VFANLDFARNVTLYVTEIIIFIVFIGAAIWARREDKKDQVKVKILWNCSLVIKYCSQIIAIKFI